MTGWLVAGAALAAALGVVLYSRWRTARLLARLDEMLTAAIDGSFAERHFDESRLSALESRLAFTSLETRPVPFRRRSITPSWGVRMRRTVLS